VSAWVAMAQRVGMGISFAPAMAAIQLLPGTTQLSKTGGTGIVDYPPRVIK